MIEFIVFNNSDFKSLSTSHPTCHIHVVKAAYQQIELGVIKRLLSKHKNGNIRPQGGNYKASENTMDLTFKHRASSIQDRRFATLQRTLFIYLINKYVSLSDICVNVHL